MEKQVWLKTVEEFFREKNRAWLQGEETTLLHYLSGTPADCHSFQEVRALRNALQSREVRYRKAKTDLQIVKTYWNREQETATVDLIEQVRFFYEQGDDIGHEARRSVHRLTLIPFGGTWKVVQDQADCEQKAPHHPKVEAVQLEEASVRLAEQRLVRGRYDRVRAFKFAELWWNSYNPAYQKIQGNDCTNFISQVVHAGGMPMIFTSSRGTGWWHRNKSWSYSWAVAHSFKLALSRLLHAQAVADPRQLKVGDVICYDWDGDGRWQHNTVVVDFDVSGMPLVNAHTVASHRRYWDYRDSYAFTARTQYVFYHIPDNF
ncbi:hypothetical protein CIG75_05350 [Tumebacillus algifaecis]|uniref:Putative amidase domain-containing protein n=1 Tax=Tumebacillus algifaecis TaxID=1214604 RepID=A0A223CZB5_9BACL|nr:amidase domain-containing protein [Tumebacillus algifaecis]ASS74473.1 hypothetical protein CIG75_05350 [Tumebacillus algifaecis]